MEGRTIKEIDVDLNGNIFRIPIFNIYGDESIRQFYVKDPFGNLLNFSDNEIIAELYTYSWMWQQIYAVQSPDNPVNKAFVKLFKQAMFGMGGDSIFDVRRDLVKDLVDQNAEARADAVANFLIDTVNSPFGVKFIGPRAVADAAIFIGGQVAEIREVEAKLAALAIAERFLEDADQAELQLDIFMGDPDARVYTTADIRSAYATTQKFLLLAKNAEDAVHKSYELAGNQTVFDGLVIDALFTTWKVIDFVGDNAVFYFAGAQILRDQLLFGTAFQEVYAKTLEGKSASIMGNIGSAVSLIDVILEFGDLYETEQVLEELQALFAGVQRELDRFDNGTFDPVGEKLPEFLNVLNATESSDIKGSIDTSAVLDLGQPIASDLSLQSDSDWFRLSLPEGDRVRVEFTPVDDFPAVVVLRDAGGEWVDAVYGRAGQAVSLIVPSSGTWFVEVKSTGGTGAYRLEASPVTSPVQTPPATDAVGQGTGDAGAIADGDEILGVIEASGDEDWYEISLQAGRVYTFSLEGFGDESGQAALRALERPVVYLMDSAGKLLIGNTSRSFGGEAQLRYQPESSGTFYINARSLPGGHHYGWGDNGYVVGFGRYRLQVSSEPAPPMPADNAGNNEADAAPISAGDSIVEYIGDAGDRDVYRLDLEAGHTYRVDVIGRDGGGGSVPYLDLDVDPEPETIYEEVFSAGGDRFAIIRSNEDGFAYLKVNWDLDWTGPGTYTIAVSEIGVPGDEATGDTQTPATVQVATPITGVYDFERTDLSPGDIDWFAIDFAPAADASSPAYTSYLIEGPNEFDFDFLDEAGNLLTGLQTWTFASDDPVSGFIAVRADVTSSPLSGTPYTFEVVAYADDHGQSAATSGALSAGVPATGTMESVATTSSGTEVRDRDWFAVNLVEGHLYTVSSAGIAVGLRLREADGSSAEYDVDPSGQIAFVAEATDTYYVEVFDNDVAGTYSLSLSDLSQSDDAADDVSTGRVLSSIKSRPLAGDDTVVATGVFERVGDRDFYKVALQEGVFYDFDANQIGDRLDTVDITLRDMAGIALDDSLVENNGLVPSIRFRAPYSGDYFIEVFASPDDIDTDDIGVGSYELAAASWSVRTGELSAGNSIVYRYTDFDPGSVFRAGDEYFEVFLEGGKTYTFSFDLSGTDLTRVNAFDFRLISENGDSIHDHGETGIGTALQTNTFTVFETGVYLFHVEAQTRSDVSNDLVTIALGAGTLFDDAPNTPESAAPLGFVDASAALSGVIDYDPASAVSGGQNDVDWYSLSLLAGRTYAVTDLAGFGTVRLIDATTDRVLWTSDSGAPFVSTTNRDAFLRVDAPVSGPSTGNYNFQISMALTDPAADLAKLDADIRADSRSQTTLVLDSSGAGAAAGLFEAEGDIDWIAVTLEADRTYRFKSDRDDVRFRLIDEDGVPLTLASGPTLSYYAFEGSSVFLEVLADSHSDGNYAVEVESVAGPNLRPVVGDTQDLILNSEMGSAALGIGAPLDDGASVSIEARSVGSFQPRNVDDLIIVAEQLPHFGELLLRGERVVEGQQLSILDLQALVYERVDGLYGDAGAFVYSVTDSFGARSIGSVDIIVQPDADDPLAEDLVLSVSGAQLLEGPGIGLVSLSVDLERAGFLAGQSSLVWRISDISAVVDADWGSRTDALVLQESEFVFSLGASDGQMSFLIDPALLTAGVDRFEIELLPSVQGGSVLVDAVIVPASVLAGGTAPTTFTGDQRNEVLVGGSAADHLVGAGGADLMLGGEGDDTIQMDAADLRLDANGAPLDLGGAGRDTLVMETGATFVTNGLSVYGFEVFRGADGNDRVRGNLSSIDYDMDGGAGNDTLTGLSGDDILRGGAGDDVIAGASGNNILEGGDGIDTVSYATAGSRVEVRLWNQTATGSQATGDTISGFENAISGSGNDALIGSDGANRLEGGAGNDYFDGLGGDDVLIGGAGNDRLFGRDGADLMLGGDGDDEIHFDSNDIRLENGQAIDLGGAGRDTLVMENGATFVTNGLSVYGFEVFRGTDGDDRVRGNLGSVDYDLDGGAGNDTLTSNRGNDTIRGGAGDDLITGLSGTNILDGGDGIDTLSYADFTGRVVVRLNVQTSSYTDTISGFENAISGAGNDALIGSDGANVFTAGSGNDYLDGQGGDDILTGGLGDDRYVGGAGNDTYVIEAGADTLLGFATGDTVDLTAFTGIADFAALSATHSQDGADSVFDLGGGNSLRIANTTLGELSAGDFDFAPDPAPLLAQAPLADAFDFAGLETGGLAGGSFRADGWLADLGDGFAFAGLAPAAAPDWMAALDAIVDAARDSDTPAIGLSEPLLTPESWVLPFALAEPDAYWV